VFWSMSQKKQVIVKPNCTRVYPPSVYVGPHAYYLEKKWDKMLDEVETNTDGCWICTADMNSGGYPRIRYTVPGCYYTWSDGTNVLWLNTETGMIRAHLVDFRTTAHSYVYWCHHGTFRTEENMDISHLCSNAQCVNIEHLHLEPHVYNLSRIGCRERNGPCSHVPKCLGK